ncbi:hypothetical protein Caci_6569 [Catenulispora acidiphila DSM 44928]|uniref:Uncharacterized protein n=1 Tax=Catenulispora acidiphila (strain DSM 44928 / JCM 14897 / NBRC 102108 / NRRL B-24433 / ID139908) TaxID=479433 RepID=C7PYC5_CATAD|nr:hypothetical protein Caci_6569 [Catenulispora acidiphila DSM 44928]
MLLILPLGILLNIPDVTDRGGLPNDAAWTLRLLLGILILRFLSRYVRKRVTQPLRDSHVSRDIVSLDRDLAYELQREAGFDPVSRQQAALFIMALRTPAKVRQRIVEKYVPGQRNLSNTVSVEIQVPRIFLTRRREPDPAGPPDESFPFPMVISPKSIMYDSLEVFDEDGARLSTLSYREYLTMIAGVLRYLLTGAYGGRMPEDEKLLEHVKSVEADALEQVFMRRDDRRLSLPEVQALDERTQQVVMKLLRLKGVDDRHRRQLELAADLVRILAKRYAIVAPLKISTNGRALVTYKRLIVPTVTDADDQPADGRARTSKEYLRHLLGARPVEVHVALENAGICHSYHLSVQGPEGLYLAKQAITPDPPAGPDNRTSGVHQPNDRYEFAPHYRFRSRRGQSYAHFYGRHFPFVSDPKAVPRLQFSFYEVPPGSDFQASIAAASAAFLIGLIGFVLAHSSLDQFGRITLASDAPVLLLAFPGVAASWLGVDKAGARLFDSSLSARLSLVITVVVSVAASALYIINASNVEPGVFDGKLNAGVSLLGVRGSWWAGLTALAVVNTLCMAYRWLYRSWRYAYLAQRNT